jgi:hypothetical protein
MQRFALALLFIAMAAVGCGTRTVTQTVNVTTTETVTTTITTTTVPPPRVFVPSHGQLEYMPDLIGLGASSDIEQIHWRAYGGATAVGNGIWPKNDCEPNCADGHITPVKVTVRLTRRILCRGVLAYQLWAIKSPGNEFDNQFDVISDGDTC